MIIKKCRVCGSEDLLFDAYATWNKEEEKYELEQVYYEVWCCKCEKLTVVKEIKTGFDHNFYEDNI